MSDARLVSKMELLIYYYLIRLVRRTSCIYIMKSNQMIFGACIERHPNAPLHFPSIVTRKLIMIFSAIIDRWYNVAKMCRAQRRNSTETKFSVYWWLFRFLVVTMGGKTYGGIIAAVPKLIFYVYNINWEQLSSKILLHSRVWLRILVYSAVAIFVKRLCAANE